jgi:cytochrome P450 family 4 subfamily B polypeptide 1
LPNFDLICPAGLSLLGGAKWKRHARVMSPVFRKAKLIQHIDTIIECIDRFIDQCLKDNEINIDIVNHCQTLTTNIIGFIGFDYDLDSYVDSPSKIAFQNFVYHILIAVLFAWLPRWMIKIYLKFNWKYQRTYRQLRELTKKIVQQEQNNPHTIEQHRPKNLIASLVSSLNEQANDEQIASGLTQSEMFDEVLTAILAGYETTANAISWFIFYMSKNPQIQKRIQEELREHNLLITDDVQYLPSLTQEKLDLLTYVECVIKEVCSYPTIFKFFSLYIYRFFVCLLLLV